MNQQPQPEEQATLEVPNLPDLEVPPPEAETEGETAATTPEEEVVAENPIEEPVVETPPPAPLPTKTSDGTLILGAEEWVYIPGLDQSFLASVDVNSTTSKVSVVELVPFEREGKEWVKFRVEHKNVSTQELSLPVLRWVKLTGPDNSKQKRPVISAWIQIASLKEKADFILVDPQEMSAPISLGQSYFRDVAVIDLTRSQIQAKK